jgi:aspartate 1-decarboxylase
MSHRLHLFKAKLHRATLTHADLDYEGSETNSRELLAASGILEHEQVHIWPVTRGTRLVTYTLRGDDHSGVICINGAAAHLASPGDLVSLATYAEYDEMELEGHRPLVVHVDENNAASSPRLVSEADRHEC